MTFNLPSFHHTGVQKRNDFVRLISLGGIGNVTKNMFAYEYRRDHQTISDILIVDCGIGFPDETMFGVDLVIPDVTYLLDKLDKIRAIVLTHGHEDHIGALPFILPQLKNVPVYGTRLTAALAEVKLKDFGLHARVNNVNLSQTLQLGSFKVEFVNVTHSIPDATNLIIRTPIGIFYHGSDYKFDWTPLDGKKTEVGKIAKLSTEGILCLLSDCVRVENPGYTLSEHVIAETLETEIRNCPGKFIFTTQSSNISRIQQAINVAIKNNRRIAFLGRSIDKNVEVTRKLGYLEFPDMLVVKDHDIKRHKPSDLAIIVTGSQAQPNSALARMAEGIHKFANVSRGDVVVFSADPIPGYENAVHKMIDLLTMRGARVAYSEIIDALHVSGHGAANDLALMIGLTGAKNVLPIGGTFRQMMHYKEMAKKMGYKDSQIIIPNDGDTIDFYASHIKTGPKIDLKNIMVDGLGVGDIGNVVLRDRQTMASEGIVVVAVPIQRQTGEVTASPEIISRGFVYMKNSTKLIDDSKKVVIDSLNLKKGKIADWQFVRKQIENNLGDFLYKETHRQPLIISVVIEV